MPSRRRFLSALGVAGSAALAGCSSLPFVGGGGSSDSVPLLDDFPGEVSATPGWPSPRGDEANTGCAPNATTLSEPTEQWRSPPVPIQSTVFARRLTVSGATVLTGGSSLVGYDVVSGDQVWEQRAAFPARKPVPVADGVAWAPDDDADDTLVGVNAATGDVAQRVELPGDPTRPPALSFGEYGTYNVVPAGDGLVGYGRETPDSTWERRTFGSVAFPPAVTDGLLAAVTDTGELYAYDGYGNPAWRADLEGSARTPPVVGNRRVYVGVNPGIVALSRHGGRDLWRTTDVAAPSATAFALGGERLFAASQDAVFALSSRTGELLWEQEVGDVAGLAVGGDNVYVVVGTELRAFSREGSAEWSLDLGGEAGAGLAVTENRLYTFVTDDEDRTRLVALA